MSNEKGIAKIHPPIEDKWSSFNCDTKLIKSVKLTFTGNLPFFDENIRFVGFDTNHARNWSNPKSRTAEAVKKDVIRLAKEMAKIEWEIIQPLVVARKL